MHALWLQPQNPFRIIELVWKLDLTLQHFLIRGRTRLLLTIQHVHVCTQIRRNNFTHCKQCCYVMLKTQDCSFIKIKRKKRNQTHTFLMSSRFVISGDSPPCTHRNCWFISAARGRQSKASIHASYTLSEYLILPVMGRNGAGRTEDAKSNNGALIHQGSSLASDGKALRSSKNFPFVGFRWGFFPPIPSESNRNVFDMYKYQGWIL